MLSMTLFFVNCENKGQLTQSTSDVEKQNLNKKPVKPELISFEGDLVGSQEVEDCCPNAGPYPDYTMTLSGVFPTPGTYNGNIFMNVFGRGKNKEYKVQFWTETMFLEVIGGNIQKDKITKTTTVTFTNELCEIWMDDVLTAAVNVNFVLTRAPASQ